MASSRCTFRLHLLSCPRRVTAPAATCPEGVGSHRPHPHRPGGGPPAGGHDLHVTALEVAVAGLDPLPRPGLHGQLDIGPLGPPPAPPAPPARPGARGPGRPAAGPSPAAPDPGGRTSTTSMPSKRVAVDLGPQGPGARDEDEVVEVHPELGAGHDPGVGRAHGRAPRGGRGGGEESERQRRCHLRHAPSGPPPPSGAGVAITDADGHDGTPLQPPRGKQGSEGGEQRAGAGPGWRRWAGPGRPREGRRAPPRADVFPAVRVCTGPGSRSVQGP